MLSLSAVTDFSICGNSVVYCLLQHLSLPHVQELDINDIPFGVIRRLVSSSTDLRKLTLGGITGVPSNPLPISLPALTSLSYIEASPSFLDCIHAPQLKSLTVGGEDDRIHIIGMKLRGLVERSKPALTSLCLKYAEISDDDTLWCLQRLPCLQHLGLWVCDVSDAVLRALSEPPSTEHGTEWLLPQLTTITLQYNEHVTPRAVTDFLASRSAHSSTPRITGRLKFFTTMSKDEYHAIQSFGDFIDPKDGSMYTANFVNA